MTTPDALYETPELIAAYDVLNSGRADYEFYVSQLPKKQNRILDIGCGTGTFAIELASAGHHVDAVDPAPGMIAAAKHKPGSDVVNWNIGTSSSITSENIYDVIVMTGHAFQCLLTDSAIQKLFQDARRLLADGGVFLFETRNPFARAWENWNPESARPPRPLGSGKTVQVIHKVQSVEAEIVTFSETYCFEPEGKQTPHSVSQLRFANRDTVLRIAESAGLKEQAVFGDWDGSAFIERESPEIIFAMSRDL